jgi:hypothetical protein
LVLENGKEFTIPLREDGYIYATGLCKAVGKRVFDWLRLKETKNLQQAIQDKLKNNKTGIQATKNNNTTGIITTKLIEIHQAGNKYNQGTWVHPDLGLNLAQWCCPDFSLQVSKWLKELIFTGSVEIEKEKTDVEIEEKYKELIKELEETKDKLENAENLIQKYDNSNKELSKKYNKIYLNHQYYLRRKELYKLKKGNCVYLIDMKLAYGDEETNRIKVGITSDITNRVSGFRTSNPFCKVLMVLYTYDCEIIEKCMKNRYKKFLVPNNSEFITGIDIEELKKRILEIANVAGCEYTIESDEEIEKFNKHIIKEDEVDETNEDEIIDARKRCGGMHHETEESRILPLSEYFKNKSNVDGYSRLCKNCFLIGVYGDKRKRRKVVVIPTFDTTTHKWCNLCESVKEHKDFYADKMKKDGLNANCKTCKNNQKKKWKEKKKEDDNNEEEYNEDKYTEEEYNEEEYNEEEYNEEKYNEEEYNEEKYNEEEYNEDKEFDKNVFNEKYTDRYTTDDLKNIATINNLSFNSKQNKTELINIIKENVVINPLEKYTKSQLRKMATEKNLKVTHRFAKAELIKLMS